MAINATSLRWMHRENKNLINTANISSPEDKLNWVFNVFDGDGGGTIDSNEINTMMVGLFEMAGAKVTEEQLAVRIAFLFSASDVCSTKFLHMTSSKIQEACADVMNQIDSDGDGEVKIIS